MNRRIVLLCLMLLVAFGLCIPSSADDVFYHDGITLERDIALDAELDDGFVRFNSDYNRWKDASGRLLSRAPTEYNGQILYDMPGYTVDGSYAVVDLPSARDCSNNGFLRFFVFLAADGFLADYSLEIEISAGEHRMISAVSVPVGKWCSVTLDIGSWGRRDAITRIALSCTDVAETNIRMTFSHLRIDEEMDVELRERFMTDRFTVRGGEFHIAPGAAIAHLTAVENSPMLSANVLVPDKRSETNALRLVFDNATDCKQVTLEYAYRADGANAKTITLEIDSGTQICLFEVPNAAAVRYVRLIFTGARSGFITLRAFNAVSVYGSEIDSIGTVADCSITPDGRFISVSGTVVHDVMIANRDHCLALFRMNAWETAEQVLSDGREPIALADISIRFEFKLPLEESDYAALGAAYLVAIRKGEAEYTYVPIADPRSLYVPTDLSAPTESGRKGVQTDLVSLAGQAGASVYLLDVYLDRLCDGSADGYLYAGRGVNCYFNRNALDALDRAVLLRSAAGEAVYLRFLISNDEAELPYAISPDEALTWSTRGILLGSEEARDTVAAITEFLVTRYSGEKGGTITGIIVGTQVDNAGDYNDIGRLSLSEYTDHYADLLTLIANTARRKNPAIRVVVPISDRRSADCITANLLMNGYDSELFLRSLFMRIDNFGGPALSLMLESEHNPFSLEESTLNAEDTSVAAEEEPGAYVPDYYNADDLGDFSALLDHLSDNYSSMPDTFLYCWMPTVNTGDALPAAYAYLYYRLRFSTHAEAFIISFARAETSGDMSGMPAIRRLMQYIDTDRSLEVSEPSLAVLGADAWSSLIEGFDERVLPQMTRYEGALFAPTGSAVGKTVYWQFGTAYSTRGWSAGSYVNSLAVRGNGNARALEAALDCTAASAGEYAEVIYRFSPGEPLGVLDRLSFSLAVEGDGVWEICVSSGNSILRLEQKKTVKAGERVTLCFNTAAAGDAAMGYLKLCAKPVSGTAQAKLCLYSVTGESDTMNSAALDGRLRELRLEEISGGSGDAPLFSPAWIFILCAVVIFSAAIAVILDRRQREEVLQEEKHKSDQ